MAEAETLLARLVEEVPVDLVLFRQPAGNSSWNSQELQGAADWTAGLETDRRQADPAAVVEEEGFERRVAALAPVAQSHRASEDGSSWDYSKELVESSDQMAAGPNYYTELEKIRVGCMVEEPNQKVPDTPNRMDGETE